MGTRMPILPRLPSALSTALLEWILMLLLFIDAVYSFLVTRFARLCRLPAPCPFCSRLDHILGNEKPCFYRELICKTHKSEISSLAFCSLHQKLTGAQNMCERCCGKVPDDDKTDETVMDANILDSKQRIDDALNSPREKVCSCCGQHFKQRSVALSSRKNAELELTGAFGSPKTYTEYSVVCQVDEPLEPKDIYHQTDYRSNERDGLLQMTSDSEIEVPCANDVKSSQSREASVMDEDLQEDTACEQPILPSPVVIKESEIIVKKEPSVEDTCNTSLACPAVDDHPNSGGDVDQTGEKESQSRKWAHRHDPVLVIENSGLEDAGISQIPVLPSDELPQVPGEIEPSQSTNEGNADPYTSQFTILEEHYAVSEEGNIKCILEQVHVPEITGRSSGEFHQRSASAADPHTNELVLENAHHGASEDANQKGSSGEVPQDHSATEEYPKTSDSIVERRPSLSTQISMNEAYRLAIGNKGSLPSPTLTDVILGKDSTSSINEELRLLLSQLSASRGLEAPWVDPGPSPRAYGRGDELVVQNITNRISLERNASGLESLDGSIVSEMEGESTIDRLRRQIDLDRKSIHLLCRELEEERNASAIAASQALAMITKLQDEKAAMQMEASHYQRMMEEQAEYDSEALAKTNELLAEREQQIEELEIELENYRRQYGGGAIEERGNQAAFKQENRDTAMLDVSDLEDPLINTQQGINSLVSLEEERAYIASGLRKLEQKLQFYSNNSVSVDLPSPDVKDDLSDKVYVIEDFSLHRQKSSIESKEAGSSTTSGEVDLVAVQEEIAKLNRRLKTLEGDRSFLEHSINSLRNGDEGLMFIQEIACNLRELRAIAIDKK
ncbi:probable myosin-binding protein 4 isoform X3 [Miscanthus floridulus]|uniref:probable myosin-binding protein 4 isoform X3 n=1 Tax=Miscanthus floridulus TaxID=154761 RepID=UPI0034580CEB